MANSFSTYPNQIDGYATLPLVRNQIDEIRAQVPNRLRDAIIKIEQELGTNPSGAFATVRDRLDTVADADTKIEAHLIDPIDAHDASSISILDSGDNYVSVDIEGALGELASLLPTSLDVIGDDNPDIPNDGFPSFVGGLGTVHVFDISVGGNILTKTQPLTVTGIHIIDVSDNHFDGFDGSAQIKFTTPSSISWKAPGDSAFGKVVDIDGLSTGLSTGDIVTLSSDTTSKKIRVARSNIALPVFDKTDTFEISRLDAVSGTFSIETVGFQNSNFITRTAINSTDADSRNQFMIGGIVFPADKGTLVLQRKLRASSQFAPMAVLDLGTNFDEDKRVGQPVYVPTLQNFDAITLFDRLPVRKDYETLLKDANGNPVYDNFDVSTTFLPFQIAKYLIPASNNDLVGGLLESTTDITLSETSSKVSVYRMVHFKTGITDFNGDPDEDDIFNISDAYGSANDGDNTVRMSNVFVDTDNTRPGINQVLLRPTVDVEILEKAISGISYYNSGDDLFDIELRTETNIFSNTYLRDDILRFNSDVFNFPGSASDGYGENVKVDRMLDDGYAAFSTINLPTFTDRAFYLINTFFLDGYRIFPDINKFSTSANISATIHEPFGKSDRFDAYGFAGGQDVRLLVNSFDVNRATETREWFTDESKRVGRNETFSFNIDRTQFISDFGANSDGNTLNAWDSTLALPTGSLQCGGKFNSDDINNPGLIFPQDNYKALVRPIQTPGPRNYGNPPFQVDSFYQRLFNLNTITNEGKIRIKSSGISLVTFENIQESNSVRPIQIEVKIPGPNGTGFLDCGKLFETGKISDGDGAINGTVTGVDGDFTVPFTFGIRNTADTNGMIAVRITYFGDDDDIRADARSKVISFVELLP